MRFDTVEGAFDLELFDDQVPVTVNNFLGYVNTQRYDGSVVHRNSDTSDPVLRDFVIQGGGFFLNDPTPPSDTISFANVVTDPPIDDEPGGGVTGPSNVRGTIAMAKSGTDTVTSQWFINQGDNSILDSPTRPDGGFSAFGQVLGDGMTVVDAIGDLPLPSDFGFGIGAPFNDLPLRNFSGDSIDDIREIHTVVVERIFVFADFNHDNSVNSADLAILNNNFGNSNADFEDGDADNDGTITGKDFLIWQRAFGEPPTSASATTSAIPEPTSVALAACGLAALCSRMLVRARQA
ncbi:peptidylprolyl isomerase [Adhaeretor mobilis]|uniref:peptidylprolyl isomerase n=1 Tax=Adhaeretor mobilis TaxID=1930276 RepID=UPI001C54FAD2|nr:peptidylprolyl isomerase [Adhaeretor mobilis]